MEDFERQLRLTVVEALRLAVEAIKGGQREEADPASGAEFRLTQTFGNRFVAMLEGALPRAGDPGLRKLVVEVPGRPPTPNARRHWRTIAKDNAKWKAIARDAALDAALEASWDVSRSVLPDAGRRSTAQLDPEVDQPMQYADLAILFVLTDERHRDLDNLISSTKALVDGCVAAGVVVDDSMTRLPRRTFEAVLQRHVSKTVLVFTERTPPDSFGL